MITRVTITGADNSIQPAQLLTLQREFPFVEWGILVSRTAMGRNRFPDEMWLHTLAGFQSALNGELNLSCHLCGGWVKQILLGGSVFIEELSLKIWNIFPRVQINTHAEPHAFTDKAFLLMRDFPDKEFIFQYDDVNTELNDYAVHYGVSHSVLFDLSHGIGRLPSQWPDLLPGTKCGYAGGLSPENLKGQIELIEEKAGDTPIWIDMETHVRSDNDALFDLDKVRRCLEIAAPYINERT